MFDTSLTCSFTGHRPNSLPWGEDETDKACKLLKLELFETVRRVIENGYTHFIVGGAMGVDTYSAEIVIQLKKIYPHVTMEIAIPCLTQSKRWDEASQKRYKTILKNCDKKTVVSVAYTQYCMHLRNQYMVNNCSLLVAVSNGNDGGTQNTIKYAKTKKIETIILNI